MIEGDVQELKNIFDFATYTDCTMIYFHIKGDVFLLYKGGHYVYFKTAIIASKNVAIPNLSCQNIFRFINAEIRRAKREERDIYTIRLEKEYIISSAFVDTSYKYKVPMQTDTFFSTTAGRLKDMLKNSYNTTGNIRIQKKILTYFTQKSAPNKQSYLQIYIETNELIIERIQNDGTVKKRIAFDEGFNAIESARNAVFILNDSALQVLKVRRMIPKDAYMYLSKNDEFVQLEYNGTPGTFRFFLPIQNKVE